ncbi:MAG TPA: diguanylate cyclase [Syntrophorhabdaceae bacterium]|nr:diguanylate cyclase [Syntrophorhabdaceae bacterium]
MMKSVRIQLLILVFAVVLPAFGIIIYSGYERQRHDVETTKADALIMAQVLGNDHENDVEATRGFLMTLARLPVLQNRDAAACNKLFRELLRDNPQYTAIYAADRDGRMYANALPFGSISIKQRDYFQEALRTKSFSAGNYSIGIITGRTVQPFAFPVTDSGGRVTGVVAVSLDLEKYGRGFEKITQLPKGSTLNLLDGNYTRLYRYPDNDKYVGQADLPEMIRELSKGPREGVFTAVGVDGTRRIFAYRQFFLEGGSSPYVYLRIGIPEEQALAPARKSFLRNLALVTVSLVAAGLTAWLLAHLLIVRRLDRLVDASMKVGQGDFSTRTGLDHEGGELGQLARSFDEMAQSLEKKELDRRQAVEALRESEIKFKSYAEQAIVGVYLLQGEVFKYVNPKFAEMFGYTVEECLKNMPFKNLVYTEDLANVTEQIGKRLTGKDDFVHYSFRGVKKNGQIFDVEIYGSSSIHEGRLAAAGTILDITERKRAEEEIKRLATHDALTDLPTMKLAKDRLKMAISLAQRNQTMLAVMFIDLDDFKKVNDTLGHDAGDYVLKQVADRLLCCVRSSDTVARVGGDEFLIIANDVHIPKIAEQIAEKVINSVSSPIVFNGGQAFVGSSIGIAIYPNDGQDIDQLIKQADKAMYRAKNAGKNNFGFANSG